MLIGIMVRMAAGLVAAACLAFPAAAGGQAQQFQLTRAEADRLRAYHERIVEAARGLPRRTSLTGLMGPVLALASKRSTPETAIVENRAAVLAIAFYANGRSLTLLTPEARGWPRAEGRRLQLAGRGDLSQHFTISAAVAAAAGAPVANLVGLYKEIDDARRGSGFSFVDLAADRAGTMFGRLATESPSSAREVQVRLAAGLAESDLMPDISGLPEGLSEREFTSRYRGERAGAYDALVEEIDRRIETVWRGSGLFSTDSAFAVPGLRPQAWHR